MDTGYIRWKAKKKKKKKKKKTIYFGKTTEMFGKKTKTADSSNN